MHANKKHEIASKNHTHKTTCILLHHSIKFLVQKFVIMRCVFAQKSFKFQSTSRYELIIIKICSLQAMYTLS